MLLIGFPAAAFATNCYILAAAPGEECVVVDPGIGVIDEVREVLADHRLRPAAVALTHGHIDHVYSVTPVCRAGGPAYVPAYIHGDDRYRLVDPLAMVGAPMIAMLEQEFGRRATWTEPDDLRPLVDLETITLAALDLTVLHAPGHTEGSVMFRIADVPDGVDRRAGVDRTVLSGDVLFAGSIGRTDLPGGDAAAMTRSLRDVVLPLSDSTLVLPGHGPATTMARERAANPYLQGLGA